MIFLVYQPTQARFSFALSGTTVPESANEMLFHPYNNVLNLLTHAVSTAWRDGIMKEYISKE